MRKRPLLIGGLCLAGIAAATGFAITRDNPATAATEQPSEEATSFNLVAVEQRDLIRSADVDGVIGHGEPQPLRLGANGTVTSLPAVDDVIEFGQAILEVDGEPIVLLPGARPAWRAVGAGVGKGEDVRQLEAALVSLGYADPEKVIVDDTWTSATTAAVKALQKLLGMPVDGQFELGEVVFSNEVIRFAEISGGLGDAAPEAGLVVTGLQQSVDVSLTAAQAAYVKVGDTVTVELPSGDTIDGVIEAIGQPVSADGNVTFPVVVSTADIDAADGIPVVVTFRVVAVEQAIAVPAEALLALAEGGYAIEVPDPSSTTGTRLVGIQIGTFADGWVEVTGDVKPGDQVVVP